MNVFGLFKLQIRFDQAWWFLALCLCHAFVWADLRVEREEVRASGKKGTFIPYAFASESQGTALGLSYVAADVLKPGTNWIVAGHVTDKDGQFFSTFFHNYQLEAFPRIAFSGGGYVFNNPALRGYFSLDPDSNAGSNDSSAEDYIETAGDNNYFDVRMNLLLPWADGQNVNRQIRLKQGIVVGQGVPVTSYNPLKSGRSYLELRLTRDYQNYDSSFGSLPFTTNLLRLEYRHNNADLPRNPTRGNQIRAAINTDGDWLDSTQSYTFVDAGYAHYWDLGVNGLMSQQVLAVNAWTADTPSWNKQQRTPGQVYIEGRPPPYKGATLGGLYRLKAYDANRFHDRSAIYYGAEYRATFRYNPSKLIGLLQPFGIDWFQAVLYGEAGRVASSYDLQMLHSDMKTDIGLGIRTMASTQVFRFDLAYGEEGAQMWVMVGHPF